MFTKVNLIFTALLLAYSAYAAEPPSKAQLASILMEAEDYLLVKPSKSLAILATNTNLAPLSESQFLRWHIAIIRASVSLNRLSIMEQSIQKLIEHKSSAEFNRRLVPILSSIGIWLRKSGYLPQAKLALTCALTHNKIEENKVKLLTSLAIVSRHLNQNDYAVETYNLAKHIAQDKKLTPSLATIENNLGVIALENDDVIKAEHHFRTALAMYQENSIRSGNIISGINLLQTFLIQHQQVNYQRLSPTIARLTDAFPNESRQSTLFWLNTVFNARQGMKLSEEIKTQLTTSFNKISDRKLKFSLKKHFADELKIKVDLPDKTHHEKLPPLWFEEITQCDWEKLKSFKLEDLK